VRFGLSVFPLGQMRLTVDRPAPETVTRIAQAADEAGFDFVCAQDHVVAPREWAEEGGGETWFDPFVVLSWVAAATARVKLVTDVLVLPYRSPFAVAKTSATLDVLSGGRVVLGVGAGYLEREFRILGAPFETRGEWTDEALQAIKRAWTGEYFDFEGKYLSARDVAVSPAPVQRPRPKIWVGGNSLRALRRAVEHGDGWTPFRGDPTTVVEALRQAREGFGLDRPLDVVVPMRKVYGAEGRIDAEGARRQAGELAEAGVTHAKVGFVGPALDGYLRAVEDFGREVIGRTA
jgi:probable F420-dependent oxidoreductase